MSRKRKITIIGNSVSLRIRPKERNATNLVYSQIVEKILNNDDTWIVNNMGQSRYLLSEFDSMKDFFIRSFPDFFIINLGCVDAPTRDIPRWYSNIIFRRNKSVFYSPLNFLYIHVIKKNSALFVKLRGKKSWNSSARFKAQFINLIRTLKKETSAKLIVLGINEGNTVIEEKLPGSIENYKKYNDILMSESKALDVSFISVADLESAEYFPDGVHYNSRGHVEIGNRICKEILKA